jgi:hypothetical protein
MIASGDIHSTHDAVDVDADASNAFLNCEIMLNTDPEREPGEVWEGIDASQPSKPLRPPSHGEVSVADQLV